ncbi:MAG: Gfo/Idh/MocA family oxidoreductase [Phycisphaeraceae bacterium]
MMATDGSLRGVMIGAGYFGDVQADAWQRVEGARIVAVCDRDEPRARKMADRYGIEQVYADAAAMLDAERPDFVDIVTRPDAHLALTRLAAERGCHVLCQKPAAATLDEARRIVDVCAQRDVRLMINENWRWQPWYRWLRDAIARGEIGEPFHSRVVIRRGDGQGSDAFARQPYFREMPRLLIFETLIHTIDVSRFLFGDVGRVACVHRRLNPHLAGEDYALLTLEMASGVTVLVDANRYAPPAVKPFRIPETTTVEGTGGTLSLTMDGGIERRGLDGTTQCETRDWPDVGYFGDAARATQQHFVDGLRTGAPFETDGPDNLKTLATVFAAYDAAEKRAWVQVGVG